MKSSWKLIFGLLCALILIASGLLRVLERVPVTTQEPPSAEAQRNRFLAAQRLLTTLDVPWEEIRGLPTELPAGPGTTVIWPFNRGNLPRHTLDAIERFVESGGHLVVEAEWWTDDPMLERFGIARHQPFDDDEGEDDEDADEVEKSASDDAVDDNEEEIEARDDNSDDDCGCAATPDYSGYIRSGDLLGKPEVWLAMQTSSWLTSTPPPIGSIGPPNMPRLLHIARGAGRITAMTSFGPMTNDGLGLTDNAEALLRLINLPKQANKVLFVRPQPGGLGDWLRQNAWRVIAVGALLLVLALWSSMPRFGPIEADPAPRRRRLLDHLLASGRLLWNNQQQAVLATAAAQAALDRVRSEYPHTRWLAPAELAAFLHQKFALDSAVITLLLSPAKVRHPASMTTLVRACALIQNQLAPRRAGRANNPLYDA